MSKGLLLTLICNTASQMGHVCLASFVIRGLVRDEPLTLRHETICKPPLALSDAERQKRWRDRRNALAKALEGDASSIARRIFEELGAKKTQRVDRPAREAPYQD